MWFAADPLRVSPALNADLSMFRIEVFWSLRLYIVVMPAVMAAGFARVAAGP
jgi:hypothetical protein